LSGGIGFSFLRTGVESTIYNDTDPTNQFEVAVGPSGSRINPSVRLNSVLGFVANRFQTFIDTWSYTLFEADPVLQLVNIYFKDDSGQIIGSYNLDLTQTDFGITQGGTPLPV